MSTQKPIASLSLDLDNQWSYMKASGIGGWESYPSYLDRLVPRILDVAARHQLTLTFFIVGQDAALSQNREALRAIALAGHEIANHSFHHEAALGKASRDVAEREIHLAGDAIEAATGVRPIGFRGPSFALSRDILDALRRLGYIYDASTFPTFLGPLARYYHFRTSKLSKAQIEDREGVFGSLADGLRPLNPYRWALEDGGVIELPVTTFPLCRAPVHLTYLSFLAQISKPLALLYFRSALATCRLAGVQPSLLLHPLDFAGGDEIEILQSFPGMRLTTHEKLALLDDVLSTYSKTFEVVTMARHAQHAEMTTALATHRPTFAHGTPG